MTRKKVRSGTGRTTKADTPAKRSTAFFITLILFAFLAYCIVANLGPLAVGVWQDDGIYLCTAKALAEGAGYRHIELPTEPLQTKYPILYPAVLALIFLVFPRYPQNLGLLLAPTALAAAGLVVLSAIYVRRVLGASRWLAIVVGTLAAFSPVIVSLVRFTMSDLLFSFFSVAGLLAFDMKHATSTTPRRMNRWPILSGLSIALAALTRAIGLSLAVAVLLSCVLTKRYRDGAVILLILTLCLGPWYAWQITAAQRNGPLQGSLLEAPDLSYSLWLPHHLSQTARVVWQNIFRVVFGVGYFQLALPLQFTLGALASYSWHRLLLYLFCWGSSLLALAGFARSWRPQWRAIHLYAILYGALMLAWPFEPFRFLVPWTPFLLYFLVTGARTAAESFSCLIALPKHRWLANLPVWAACALLAMFFLAEDSQIAASTAENFYMRETVLNCSEIRELERWLMANASPGDVVASDRPAGLFLSVGLKGQYFWPDTDPYTLYYGDDRRWWNFYWWPGEQGSQDVYREMRGRLPGAYTAARVTYYVEHIGANAQAAALAKLIVENPSWFEPCYTSPKKVYRVYRMNLRSALERQVFPALDGFRLEAAPLNRPTD